MNEDPLLKGRDVYSTPDDGGVPFFKDGLQEVNLTKDQVEFVGRKFQKVFEKINSSRNGLVMANGAIYAIGSRKNGNMEWRAHSASSVRELLHKWKTNAGRLQNDLKTTFLSGNSNFPALKKNDSSQNELYETMIAYYSYFSCVCHHEANDVIICARALDGESRKTGDDSEEDFLKKVESFFRFFEKFFSEYGKE